MPEARTLLVAALFAMGLASTAWILSHAIPSAPLTDTSGPEFTARMHAARDFYFMRIKADERWIAILNQDLDEINSFLQSDKLGLDDDKKNEINKLVKTTRERRIDLRHYEQIRIYAIIYDVDEINSLKERDIYLNFARFRARIKTIAAPIKDIKLTKRWRKLDTDLMDRFKCRVEMIIMGRSLDPENPCHPILETPIYQIKEVPIDLTLPWEN